MNISRVEAHTILYLCGDCECVIVSPLRHEQVCLANAVTTVQQIDNNEVNAEPHWACRPLTVALTTRSGQTFVLDGVEDDTRVSLSGLDAVDKAALRELLQQALREVATARSGYTASPQPLVTWNPNSVTSVSLHSGEAPQP